ncbi:MAG TPA: HEPN domain-containing protein [Candidatus Acidoferrum sp.]
MSWKKLLTENKVHGHKTSRKELEDLRAVIVRDLEDAAIQELSDDRRFATAYNAALQTAKMSIACAGFRLASTPGHHRLTFEAARLALGTTAVRSLDFFEACRRKRNVIDYDHASVATHTEAEEIVAEAQAFFELVERWIAANHPKLTP